MKRVLKLFILLSALIGTVTVCSNNCAATSEKDADNKDSEIITENVNTIVSITAVDEEQSIFVFDCEDGSGAWTAETVALKINAHNDVGIEKAVIKEDENEPEIIDYEGVKDIEKCIGIDNSSVDSSGVCVEVSVTDVNGSITEIKKWIHIDKELPEGAVSEYENSDGKPDERKDIIFSNKEVRVRFLLSDTISGIDADSIETEFVPARDETGDDSLKILPILAYDEKGYFAFIPDETDLPAYDGFIVIRGNAIEIKSSRIIYCNEQPDNIWLSDYEYGKWTNKDVEIHIETAAKKSGIREVVYYVSGKSIMEKEFDDIVYENEYDLILDKSAEKKKGYTVEVRVTDNCGNVSIRKEKILIDKDIPVVSMEGVEDGLYYGNNVKVELNISDISFEDAVLNCQIIRMMDGKSFDETGEGFAPKNYSDREEFLFSKEGKYTVNVSAIDGAGNKTSLPQVCFVIDKTSPEISLGGVRDGEMTNGGVSVEFLCDESFYETGEISVDVKRRKDNKVDEEKIDIFKHDKKKEVRHCTFEKEGSYEVTMNAKDMAGNEAERQVLHFTVDKTAPEISFTGTEAYKQWDKKVEIKLMVKEEFYQNNKVSIRGSVTQGDGSESRLLLPEMNINKKINYITLSFNKDGMYGINVDARDGAGNISRKKISFLIDTQAPVISGIEEYDGQYLKSFDISDKRGGIFEDLTLKTCGFTLNGVEYEGTEKITEEGKYEFVAFAEDELGHRSETVAEFIIDNSAPKVLFTGVEDGDMVYEPGKISWRLYNTEDKIKSIVINDKEYDDNLQEFCYNTFGIYKIEIGSIDKAGNEGISKISFEYAASHKDNFIGDKSADSQVNYRNKLYLIVLAALCLISALVLVLFILRKRKKIN